MHVLMDAIRSLIMWKSQCVSCVFHVCKPEGCQQLEPSSLQPHYFEPKLVNCNIAVNLFIKIFKTKPVVMVLPFKGQEENYTAPAFMSPCDTMFCCEFMTT